jgi:SAM-dependent methyltransferase
MNLERFRNRHGKLWLNVGSGNFLLDDFLNVDSNFLVFLAPLYPAVKPLLKAPARGWIEGFKAKRRPHNFLFRNCRRPLDLPAASVDHILISHFLEHLHLEDAQAVLRRFFSILRPGGTLHIIVPDLEARARQYLSDPAAPDAADAFVEWLNFEKRSMPRFIVRLLRVTGWFDLEHCWMYDRHSLAGLARSIGFQVRDGNDSPSAAFRRDDPIQQVNLLVQKPAS